jgi:hypothetical protein
MAPLVKCAHDTNAAIVIVAHHKKGGHEGLSGTSAQMISGSQAVGAYARSVLQVAKDEEHRTYLVHTKHNLSAKQSTLEYSVTGDGNGQPVFDWVGVVDITEEQLFSKRSSLATQERKVDASDFLCGILKTGPLVESDVFSHAKSSGVSRSDLLMASKTLGIQIKAQGDTNVWRMPAELGFRPTKYKLKS